MKSKLLYLVTEDWYFCSHRLPLARAALDAGFEVGVVTQATRHGELIKQAGLKLFPIPFSRSGKQPLQDFRTIAAVTRIYQSEKPQLVHHVSMKPILYGALAAKASGVPHIVNAYTGLGYLFMSGSRRARLLRGVLTRMWKPLLSSERCWSIVQNLDDQVLLENSHWLHRDRTTLIPGSGVDTKIFIPSEEVAGIPCVMLAARMLWDKGVGEFIDAAKQLRASGVSARFVLVGEPDPENPRTVSTEDLRRWQQEGIIEWWGRREDMAEVLRQANVVCLPSYREGLPKVLLEAMASARAVIATDVPGCREVVRHGENGLLVPPRDSGALAAAINELLSNSDRRAMGRYGRRMAEEHFSIERVVADTLALYKSVLERG